MEMEMKYFFLMFFLVINILSLVCAQDSPDSPSIENHTQTNRDTEVTTTIAAAPIISTSKSEHSTEVENKTTIPIITNPITSLDATMVITSSTSATTKPLATKTIPTKTTTTTTKKEATTAKHFPQESFVPWRKLENKAIRAADVLMKFYYVLSGGIVAVFIGLATFILYKKGIEETPTTQPSRVEYSFDDNSFRNKSTISRNTLSPSINNSSLPNPNNTQYQ